MIPKEQATVGALRAQSPDVDTAEVSRAEWRARYDAEPAVPRPQRLTPAPDTQRLTHRDAHATPGPRKGAP